MIARRFGVVSVVVLMILSGCGSDSDEDAATDLGSFFEGEPIEGGGAGSQTPADGSAPEDDPGRVFLDAGSILAEVTDSETAGGDAGGTSGSDLGAAVDGPVAVESLGVALEQAGLSEVQIACVVDSLSASLGRDELELAELMSEDPLTSELISATQTALDRCVLTGGDVASDLAPGGSEAIVETLRGTGMTQEEATCVSTLYAEGLDVLESDFLECISMDRLRELSESLG